MAKVSKLSKYLHLLLFQNILLSLGFHKNGKLSSYFRRELITTKFAGKMTYGVHRFITFYIYFIHFMEPFQPQKQPFPIKNILKKNPVGSLKKGYSVKYVTRPLPKVPKTIKNSGRGGKLGEMDKNCNFLPINVFFFEELYYIYKC